MRRLAHHLISIRVIIGFVVSSIALGYLYLKASEIGSDRVGTFFAGLANLASVAGGFIGAFYFFVAARSTTFLQKVETTKLFKDLLLLIRFSFLVSLILIFTCLRNMVFMPVANLSVVSDFGFPAASIFLAGLFFGLLWECMAIFRRLTE